MPTIVPAPKKITPAIAAQLMQRRREGASMRALEREFPLSNQAIGKFFKKEEVSSTGRRNGLSELSGGGGEAEGLPWPGVQSERDRVEGVLAVG
jgi:hypothetical protein